MSRRMGSDISDQNVHSSFEAQIACENQFPSLTAKTITCLFSALRNRLVGIRNPQSFCRSSIRHRRWADILIDRHLLGLCPRPKASPDVPSSLLSLPEQFWRSQPINWIISCASGARRINKKDGFHPTGRSSAFFIAPAARRPPCKFTNRSTDADARTNPPVPLKPVFSFKEPPFQRTLNSNAYISIKR